MYFGLPSYKKLTQKMDRAQLRSGVQAMGMTHSERQALLSFLFRG